MFGNEGSASCLIAQHPQSGHVQLDPMVLRNSSLARCGSMPVIPDEGQPGSRDKAGMSECLQKEAGIGEGGGERGKETVAP